MPSRRSPVARCAAAAGMLLAAAGPAAAELPPIHGPVEVETVADIDGAVGGVAVDRVGNVYVADFGDHVFQVTRHGEVSVLTDSLYGASGNAVDARGELLQASFYGNAVSRIGRDGTVTTLATGLEGPVGIALDDAGDLLVCNCTGNNLARVRAATGEVTRFATSDLLRCPNGITRDGDGNFYVVNFQGGAVLKVSAQGAVELLATVPGGGNGHVAYARGALYVTGFRSNRLWRVTTAGEVAWFAGTGRFGTDDGDAAKATFATPNGIAYDPAYDALYLNDYPIRFPERSREKPVSVLRRVVFPTLTEELQGALAAGGVDTVRTAYASYKELRPSSSTEIEVNILGYTWLQKGETDAAIAAFELNVESYPGSWNAHDSLGEGYAAAGKREEAIASYEKSLELNPDNGNAVQHLQKLRSEE